MLHQEKLQKNISDGLAVLEVSIENRGLVGLLDQHLLSQSFFTKLLNIIYSYDLINLDAINIRNPSIDLGDCYRKIAFQVTSTKKPSKLLETIKTFIANEQYKQFKELKFLILTKKQKSYKAIFDTQNLFSFDPKVDILDLKDLVKQLPLLSLYKLQQLSHLIDSELYLPHTVAGAKELLSYNYTLDSVDNLEQSIIEETNPDNVVRVVYQTKVPLYSDPECKNLRAGVFGIILETRQKPINVLAGYSIHPTTCTHFKHGMHVIRQYSRNSSYGESWYRDPDTNEVRYAWTESAELLGRSLDD